MTELAASLDPTVIDASVPELARRQAVQPHACALALSWAILRLHCVCKALPESQCHGADFSFAKVICLKAAGSEDV